MSENPEDRLLIQARDLSLIDIRRDSGAPIITVTTSINERDSYSVIPRKKADEVEVREAKLSLMLSDTTMIEVFMVGGPNFQQFIGGYLPTPTAAELVRAKLSGKRLRPLVSIQMEVNYVEDEG